MAIAGLASQARACGAGSGVDHDHPMKTADFLIIGGGIAGLSAAAQLARHGKVLLVEGEASLGYHASGRSATFYHFGLGNAPVRALTACSRDFFERPPEDFAEAPLCRPTPALFIARENAVEALAAMEAGMKLYTDTTSRVSLSQVEALCPILKTGPSGVVEAVVDTGGRRLDADGLLQGYARALKRAGGEVHTGQRIVSVKREGSSWTITSEKGEQFAAPILINAAGAWADALAGMAGVAPIGIQPKRRTIIQFDPPSGMEIADWPFVKAAIDEFYMLPESGRIMASPVDEVDSDPVDAAPEDYDLALAAWQVEEYTKLSVSRIAHRWAGLRSFVADRVLVAGFEPEAEGYFWLAGQGGYGLQTAPTMARCVESLLCDTPWPEDLAAMGVTAETLSPTRASLNR
jgi:D-arginine dehydrogenase